MKRIVLITVPWICILFMFLRAVLPIVFGKEYLIETEPVDPRDLFRGNYVALAYEFSSIDSKDYTSLLKDSGYNYGDYLFLYLKPVNGLLTLETVSDEALEDAADLVMVKALVVDDYYEEPAENKRANHSLELKVGIEEYFMPKDLAIEAEESVRLGRAQALLAIDQLGNARIRELMYKSKPQAAEN